MLLTSIKKAARVPVNAAAIRAGSSIPVILLEDVDNQGVAGECVKVKRGFARNYLVPKRMAVYMTEENRLKHADLMGNAANAGSVAAAAAAAAALEDKAQTIEALAKLGGALKIPMKTVSGSAGLYGSVTPAMISDALSEQGIVTTASQISTEKIGQLGIFTASVLGERIEIEVVAEAEASP